MIGKSSYRGYIIILSRICDVFIYLVSMTHPRAYICKNVTMQGKEEMQCCYLSTKIHYLFVEFLSNLEIVTVCPLRTTKLLSVVHVYFCI